MQKRKDEKHIKQKMVFVSLKSKPGYLGSTKKVTKAIIKHGRVNQMSLEYMG